MAVADGVPVVSPPHHRCPAGGREQPPAIGRASERAQLAAPGPALMEQGVRLADPANDLRDDTRTGVRRTGLRAGCGRLM